MIGLYTFAFIGASVVIYASIMLVVSLVEERRKARDTYLRKLLLETLTQQKTAEVIREFKN